MYQITARRWFQKTNGNTYHSVSVSQNNKFYGYVAFRYGYEDQYLATTAQILGLDELALRESMRLTPELFSVKVSDVKRKKDL